MKKIYIAIPLAAMMLASCDPSEIDLGSPSAAYSESALSEGFNFVQYSDEAHTQQAADGNYFTYATNPNEPVQIVTVNADGEETIIGYGTNGSFKIVPKRGQSQNVQFFVRLKNQDGSVTQVEKSANVYVPAELTPEMRYLVSDAYGEKIWTWDTEFRADEGCWGNIGYAGCSGEEFAATGGGCIWWGAKPETLAEADQRKNADQVELTGEEDRNAYMVFTEDGKILTYDAKGKEIRSGRFEVQGYTGERKYASIDGSQAAWSLGTFKTTAGSILFPFKINGGGAKPTDFEILQLDANHLKLVYVAPGTGSWKEATWWAFKSVGDAEASLTNFGSKDWTWDTEFRADEGCWGNIGYAGCSGEEFAATGGGCIWWGGKPENLADADQRKNAGGDPVCGEENRNAYMTFDWKNSTISTYDAAGNKIRGGKFAITNWKNGKRSISSIDGGQPAWALGTLETDAGSILFPYKINGGGEKPKSFEILQLDGDHLKLVYVAPGTGAWKEATWWAFKKK